MNIKAIEGMKRILLLLAIAVTGVPQELCAQKAAIKTNLVSDAFLNVNLGVETGLAPRWTFDLRGDVNVWTLSNDRRWRHWAVQPEFRYWFCDRFSGHFFGLHTHGGQYSIGGFDGRFNLLGTDARKLKDARFQGWFVGGGVAYGYTWILGPPLEPGNGGGFRLFLYPLRQIPVFGMREKGRNEPAASLRGTHQGGH